MPGDMGSCGEDDDARGVSGNGAADGVGGPTATGQIKLIADVKRVQKIDIGYAQTAKVSNLFCTQLHSSSYSHMRWLC
jgi:hypothetical protein